MGSLSPVHWFAVALVVVLLFGSKRLAALGKSLGEGIQGLKSGITDDPPRASELEDRKR
jgi:TatA/E family protein of Tat protein translocase